jgi:hypothetical protein
MHKIAICFVPGAGGVKLKHYLLHGMVNFVEKTNSHNVVPAPGQFWARPMMALLSGLDFSDLQEIPIKGNDHADMRAKWLDNTVVGSNNLPIDSYTGSRHVVLTHCMNYSALRYQFPNRIVVKIISDVLLSLRRWWCVQDIHVEYPEVPTILPKHRDMVMQLFDQSQHQFIAHHVITMLEYYQKNYDDHGQIVFRVHQDQDPFSKFINQDLENCKHEEFDHVLKKLRQVPEITTLITNLNS